MFFLMTENNNEICEDDFQKNMMCFSDSLMMDLGDIKKQ